ncbi:hypothetical protein MAH1_33800 [Sessilibacter sp. MAH1]
MELNRTQLVTGKLPVMHRFAQVEHSKIDVENRTVVLAFSSEFPVTRLDWIETLGHREDEIDLTRIKNGGPFLCDHDWKDQRGVVTKVWIENNRGYAEVKLSRNPMGDELLNDIVDGIRTHISVGYKILKAVLIEVRNGIEHYRITKWEPLELSSVSVPADPTVGVGRSEGDLFPLKIISNLNEETRMEDDDLLETETEETTTDESQDEEETTSNRSSGGPAPKPKNTGKTDAQRIAESARQYDVVDLGTKCISEGKSFDQFRSELIGTLHKRKQSGDITTTALDLDMPTRDLENYSIVRAMRAAATGKWKDAGLEREVSSAIAQRLDSDPNGVYLSYEAMGYGLRRQLQTQMMARTQAAGVATLGQELVATNLHSELFIEVLRAMATVGGLGTRFVTGLVGNVDIPKQNGSATFFWVDEDIAPNDSNITFSTVSLSPKTVSTAVPITRRLLVQSTPDIESLVRGDIMTGLALALDNAILKGSGINNEPLGILNAAGIGAVDLTGGVNWAKIVELETDVAEANASAATSSYVMRPTMRGTLKSTEKAAGTAQFIWGDGSSINGYSAAVTTEMLANQILFGDFAQILVGMWGALDVVPDRATKVATGGLVMRLFQDADVAVRHPQAFSLAA